jgi:phosphoesterase RecJ-like protein
MSTLVEIADRLRRSRRVLAVSHIAPDGDAIGSLLGFGLTVRNAWLAGSEPAAGILTLACDDPAPPQYRWLPGAADIVTLPPAGPWDIVVGLDASDSTRLGRVFQSSDAGDAPVIVIDHHITNLRFGTLNYVDTTAVATAQIMVELADALAVPISPEIAICLLTGLVTDTLGFRTSNVTSRVMAVAMRLMEAGASLTDINERILNYRPLSTLRLWGQALVNVQISGRVAWTAITRQMREETGALSNADGGLVNQLISAPEAVVAAVFSETVDGKVEISLRAKSTHDVSRIALKLGGGGHPQASGCTIAGPIAAAEARVLPLLSEAAE